MKSKFAALAALLLSSCSTYGADDLAASTGCGVREEVCSAQCVDAYEAGGNADRYMECEDRCRASAGPVCR